MVITSIEAIRHVGRRGFHGRDSQDLKEFLPLSPADAQSTGQIQRYTFLLGSRNAIRGTEYILLISGYSSTDKI